MYKEKAYLKVGSSIRDRDRVYFYNMSFNSVFFIDINDFSVHFVHTFSNETIDNERMSINGSIIYRDAIYFFPNNTNVVMKYDFLQQREKLISFKDYKDKVFATASVIQQENIIYIFPSDLGKGIYILDLHNEEITKDTRLSALFKQGYHCGEVFKTLDDCILMNAYGGNQIIEINLRESVIIGTYLIGEGVQIYSMHFDGSNYWILQMQSSDIYEWNKEDNILHKYVAGDGSTEIQESIPYSNIIFLETEILVLGYKTKKIMRINKKEKRIENFVMFPEEFCPVNKRFIQWPDCGKYDVLPEKVLLYPMRGNMLLIYDKTTQQIFGKELYVSDGLLDMEELVGEIVLRKDVCIENDDLGTFEGYIYMLKQGGNISVPCEYTNIGQLIYQQC